MPKNGFTLIELIVVIAIIITLTGLGLAGYNRFNQRETIKQTAQDIQTALRDAQARVGNGDKDQTVCSGVNLDSWKFSINPNLTSYSIYGRCGSSDFKQENYQLPSGLTFSEAKTLTFKPLNQGIISDNGYTITISRGGADPVTITVSSSGEITVSDLP